MGIKTLIFLYHQTSQTSIRRSLPAGARFWVPSAKAATGVGTPLAEVAIRAGMFLRPPLLRAIEKPLGAYFKAPSLGIGEEFWGFFGLPQGDRDFYRPTDPLLPLGQEAEEKEERLFLPFSGVLRTPVPLPLSLEPSRCKDYAPPPPGFSIPTRGWNGESVRPDEGG